MLGYLSKIKWLHATTDNWTSCQKYSYLGITAHFLTEKFALKSLTLCLKHFIGEHSAENLKETINDVFESLNITHKIVSICSDSAKNIQNGLQLLKKDGSTILTGRFMGHILQLIVNRVINKIKTQDTENISEHQKCILVIIKKCKNLATSFNHSTQLTEKLINLQVDESQSTQNQGIDQPKNSKLRLIQEVETRWHSLFMCLDRISILHSFVDKVLNSSHEYKKQRENILTSEELTRLKDLCDVLRNFAIAGEWLSSETYVTSALILPLMNFLKKSLEKDIENDSCFKVSIKANLLDSINFYLNKYDIENNILLLICSFLHPKFNQ